MITFTTYGTWLQGDKRGYVKNGMVLGGNEKLKLANQELQGTEVIKLNKKEKGIVKAAILDEAKKLNQKIHSMAVCTNHVHIVLEYDNLPIDEVTRNYKKAGYFALKQNGFVGKLWTRGFDKRYCFDEKSLRERIAYVKRHEE